MMDDQLTAVRNEIEAGSVSPHSLVLLFNAASAAEHAGDVATLEQTLELARAIAEMAGETLQAEAKRLATICEQSLTSVRERLAASAATEPRERMISCPECGNEVPPDALRCRRCGHRFI
jgi:ribosomal protein L40E